MVPWEHRAIATACEQMWCRQCVRRRSKQDCQHFQAQNIMVYQPSAWQQLQLFEQQYPLDTKSNIRIFTRVFQLVMRIIELYSNVRDKNCASEMLTQSDTGEVTSMFVPWNRDPETFSAPQTWSKTTLWNGQIEVRIGQEIGTGGPHVLRTQ